LLTADEERNLFEQYQHAENPNEKIRIRNYIVEQNLGLVRLAARKFRHMPDALSEGYLGLIHAVEKFDLSKNCKFSTYAIPWINAYLRIYSVKNCKSVKLPLSQKNRKIFYSLGKTEEALRQEGKEATSEAVAAALGVTSDEVDFVKLFLKVEKHLDAQYSDDLDNYNFVSSEAMSPEEMVDQAYTNQYFGQYIETFKRSLKPVHEVIFTNTILGERSLADVGRDLNLSRERVRQLNVSLLTSFKKFCLRNKLEPLR